MDDNGIHENGRHKPPPGQRLMPQQPSMKHIMAIMAERDAAIQERNLSISEKKAALAERDMAISQRNLAIEERNNAMIERDNAITALQYRESTINNGNVSHCPLGCQIPHDVKHGHHLQPPHRSENSAQDMQMTETIPVLPAAAEPAKSWRSKRGKEANAATSSKKTSSKPSKRFKQEREDLNKGMYIDPQEWKSGLDTGCGGGSGSGNLNRQYGMPKPNWKDQDLGLNHVPFDDSTMPVPVCSCTGVSRPCYKWGSGGWQSSCCTTNLSMYPLPAVPNKRHARVGGRKMSGSAFNKLLTRLAAEGHDLSNPVDLKEHWAKHGTNRYITIK